MKFGLFYLFSDFGDVAQDRLLHEVLEEITYAEELGFESVWLPEHHFAIYGMLGNPMIFAASVAERTRRMKIGTAIMVVPFQHPLRLAEDAATVDALSNGRLLLGLGRGYQPPEFEGFGLDQSASREMFDEGFEIVRRALSGERFAHQGRFWTFRDPVEIYPKPIQKPHPPFYLAAISPGTYDLAARLGISLLRSPTFTDLDTVTARYEGYRARMREHGHDPDALDQPFLVRTYVAPTDEEARAETRHVVWYYHLLGSLVPGAPTLPRPSSYEAYPDAARRLSAVGEDEVWERGSCFGSPERVAAMLKRYLHRTGTNHIALEMRIGGLEHRKVMRSLELFAREVMPEVRAAAGEETTWSGIDDPPHERADRRHRHGARLLRPRPGARRDPAPGRRAPGTVVRLRGQRAAPLGPARSPRRPDRDESAADRSPRPGRRPRGVHHERQSRRDHPLPGGRADPVCAWAAGLPQIFCEDPAGNLVELNTGWTRQPLG